MNGVCTAGEQGGTVEVSAREHIMDGGRKKGSYLFY